MCFMFVLILAVSMVLGSVLLYAFRDLWKEWGDSNFLIISQNCQFHHRWLELLEHLMCFFIYHSEHYGLILEHAILFFTRSLFFIFVSVLSFVVVISMSLLYVSLGSRVSPSIFGLMFMGSMMLSICSSSCVLYSAGSDVKRVHVVLSGLRMKLFV